MLEELAEQIKYFTARIKALIYNCTFGFNIPGLPFPAALDDLLVLGGTGGVLGVADGQPAGQVDHVALRLRLGLGRGRDGRRGHFTVGRDDILAELRGVYFCGGSVSPCMTQL